MFDSVRRTPATSRGFRCALFGIAMTILARLGPWAWPGRPATLVLDFALAHAAPSVAGPITKALGLLTLIFVNAGFWALVAYAVLWLMTRMRSHR